MSELTECNFCTYQRILRRAKEKGQTVTTKAEAGGVAVLVDGKQIAWFMELPEHCWC